MSETNIKDILEKSMDDHGWPDSQLSYSEMSDIEFGTEHTTPNPALRKALPKIDESLAKEISEALLKALS